MCGMFGFISLTSFLLSSRGCCVGLISCSHVSLGSPGPRPVEGGQRWRLPLARCAEERSKTYKTRTKVAPADLAGIAMFNGARSRLLFCSAACRRIGLLGRPSILLLLPPPPFKEKKAEKKERREAVIDQPPFSNRIDRAAPRTPQLSRQEEGTGTHEAKKGGHHLISHLTPPPGPLPAGLLCPLPYPYPSFLGPRAPELLADLLQLCVLWRVFE